MSRVGRRRVRAAAAIGVTAAVVGVAGVAAAGFGGTGPSGPPPRRTAPAATVTVTRQTLVESVTLAGELGYGTAVPLASHAAGTVTWLPEVGAVVQRGRALLRADDQPVVLLYGELPMYRALAEGVKGADVAQLERNLVALGYGRLTVDDTYSAATTAAVKRWQKDLGLAESGVVDRERVVYAPGPLRVARLLARTGAAATGDVLSYTGTVKVVTVGAAAGETAWASRGAPVTVALPGGVTVAGAVESVGTEASVPADARAPGTAGNPGTATVSVTVTIGDQRALAGLDTSPVELRYVARERKDVLTVPVSALLALAEGGYGLEVVDNGGSRIVTVQPGLFADGRVEVSGDGVTEGAKVGMPR